MGTYDLDLFVIGGGSGGVRAARVAAQHGARVAIAEEHRYGGTCVIRGCIPKKLFVYASHFSQDFEDARAYGWSIEGARFDWPSLVAAKDREIARLSGLYRKTLEGHGVEVLEGRAILADPHTVEVDGRRWTARYVLIATGGRPWKPPVPGMEHAIVSDQAFHLPELGQRIAIAGGGYIGVEFAGIFRGLGRQVTLIHRRDLVLRGFDLDVRESVNEGLRRAGVDVRTSVQVTRVEKRGPGLLLTLTTGETLEVDQLLCATGREPNTSDLGLLEAGVALSHRGAVVVDDFSRSSVDHIYAVGDCTDRIQLTPVAIREGHAVADTLFGGRPTPVDHECVPTAVFSQPPAASVGLTEAEARERYGEIDVYRTSFRPLKYTLAPGEQRTMMKLLVDADSQRLLGAHMVGDDAPEIIQTLAIAVKMGAKKQDLDATTALHPTSAEELVLMRTPVLGSPPGR